jgi:hypothetical protein
VTELFPRTHRPHFLLEAVSVVSVVLEVSQL